MPDSAEENSWDPRTLDEEIRQWQQARELNTDKPPLDPDVVDADVRKWARMKELAAQAAPSTPELIRRALQAPDPDTYWDYVMILHYRGTREVLEAARALSRDANPAARSLAADMLSRLGAGKHPFPVEAGDTLLQMLETETEPVVLRDIGVAFADMHDDRALEPLLRLQHHPDPDVRFGVARGLGSAEGPEAEAALIALSRDPDADVREWATFGLGLQIIYAEGNVSSALRDALLARLTDEDDAPREEALLALAELRDERVIAPLIAELRSGAFTNRLIWAIGNLGDSRFCAGLQELRAWWHDRAEVDRALAACGCPAPNGHGAAK
jgi:HEAT repeat protein